MKNIAILILFFLFSEVSLAANTLTIQSGNTVRDIMVGDKIINIKEMNGVIKIELQLGSTADEGLKKLSDLINKNKFSLNNLKGFSEIFYKKDTATMFIKEHRNKNLTEMNCYTGKTKYLGRAVGKLKNTIEPEKYQPIKEYNYSRPPVQRYHYSPPPVQRDNYNSTSGY